MSNSPLQLNRYFFTKISLQAALGTDPNFPSLVQTATNVARHNEQENSYFVRLNVKLVDDGVKRAAYTGEFELLGFFEVDKEYPKEKRDELVAVNGASLLFGAAREMIANLTARGPWPLLEAQTTRFTYEITPAPKGIAKAV